MKSIQHSFSYSLSLAARFLLAVVLTSAVQREALSAEAAFAREIDLKIVKESPVRLTTNGSFQEFTWWLPQGADQFALPIAGGVVLSREIVQSTGWLQDRSPWELKELPVLGARYEGRYLTVIVPSPHYAELVVSNRLGVRFTFPPERESATPVEIVAQWTGSEPMDVVDAFRQWRNQGKNLGAIPRAVSLRDKIKGVPSASALPGAPHFYLWGPALFSRHDVAKPKWLPLAKFLSAAPTESPTGRIVQTFSEERRRALSELAKASVPMDYLTTEVAAGIQLALQSTNLFAPVGGTVAIWERNRTEVAEILSEYVNPPSTWGDGPSTAMLDELHGAGIEKGVLVLSDLYSETPRPDVADHARKLGYLFGPYDSYHSVHDPKISIDTWVTAQFDEHAFRQGRVLNRDGSGHSGFRGRGFHFAPSTAWPYVQKRVGGLMEKTPYSAWFIDCDATAESFDDYHPQHSGSRVDDIGLRRDRLRWLAEKHNLVVGSEGGSILFADVIHFGHGTQTPYIGHLDKAFRDPASPHFLGKYWPSDGPDAFFKPSLVPASLLSPYFDPTVRFPMYQAAVGDELIATHHWSFDSLKFSDLAVTRELMEILYMTPPMYHLNRATWPKRKERILRHVQFWSPLHAQLATAPMTNFEYLTKDRLVQRTTFDLRGSKKVMVTANFGDSAQAGFPPTSITVTGLDELKQTSYRAMP